MDVCLPGIAHLIVSINHDEHLHHVVSRGLPHEVNCVGSIIVVNDTVAHVEGHLLGVQVEGSDDLNLVVIASADPLVSALVERHNGEHRAVSSNCLSEGGTRNLDLIEVCLPCTASHHVLTNHVHPESLLLPWWGSDHSILELDFHGGLLGKVVRLMAVPFIELEVRDQVLLSSLEWAVDCWHNSLVEHRKRVQQAVVRADLIRAAHDDLLRVLCTKDDWLGGLWEELHVGVVDHVQELGVHVQPPLATVVRSGDVLPSASLDDGLPAGHFSVLVALGHCASASSVHAGGHSSVGDTNSEAVQDSVISQPGDDRLVTIHAMREDPSLDCEGTCARPQVLLRDELKRDGVVGSLPLQVVEGIVLLVVV
mmetsp:Transcript_12182/g.14535  ORF Transcript_12182/g.14535 Transcript_12182/m.14535 type:complete len:367 (+) Transcript_12182:106-1206(+)